jgi:pilus assembly protein CpaC
MFERCAKPNRFVFVGFALLSTLLVGPSVLLAQQPTPLTGQSTPPATQAPPVVAAQPAAAQESEGPQTLHLLVGRSLVISSPTRIKRISLADPNIAEAIVVSPTQVLVNGKTPGGVSLLLWDEADQSQAFEVSVDIDVLGLSQKIHEVFPTEDVHIETSKDVIMLSGKISSTAVADKILEVVKNSSPKVTSLMQVPLPPANGEILLEVKFAELDRSVLSQLGVNLFSTGATNTVGTTTTGQFGSFGQQQIHDFFPSPGVPFSSQQTINDVLNLFLFRPDIHLGAVIKALEQKNVLQILAEPNLLTENDKEASFLAGGEFPFPIVQPGQGFTAVTITFKEFGVRLNFKPTLTADGKIHLHVRPEVSSLDFSNALTISGFVIPALSTRRVETDMTLEDGQSFAIAGLVDDRVTKTLQKVPGLGDLPIFGKLFQSRGINSSKNELLVLVTPRIVQPVSADKAPKGPAFPEPFLAPAIPAAPQKPASPK